MIIPIYAGRIRGTFRASFDRRPGLLRFDLVVPGGSQVLDTRAGLGSFKALFVPTSDPMQYVAWLAVDTFFEAKKNLSRFRIIRPRSAVDTAP
jgi:hypothetical protein